MNTLELPVTYPFISVYPKHAIPFSFLTNRDSFEPWLMSNYIQLKCSTTFMTHPTDAFDFFTVYPEFYETPPLQTERLVLETVQRIQPNFTEFIQKSLMQGKYIYTHLDEFYIPDTPSYGKNTSPHANLIYGFNDRDRTFNIGGYNENLKYTFKKISYSQLEESSKSIVHIVQNQSPEIWHDFYKFIYMIKYRELTHYTLDVQWMIDQLKDYLSSSNSSGRFRGFLNKSDDFYGLEVYDKLIAYYKDKPNNSDLKPPHLIWEHKKLMLMRIEYLVSNQIIAKDQALTKVYAELIQLSKTAQNILIKYRILEDEQLLNKVINIYEEIRAKEETSLQKLLSLF
ncbi:hypothetical protein J7E78_11190 [Paenibacillus polymyxa]|uniref:hypothetical protein n=1 Tax=Paenibacillus polymyxa TaxID=1406 RepID=UPI001BEC63FC|nr:hypothetical protein [Paenibacillus polymyxa]MBT2284105.1 hypothetical protein [Paenibacillus polymyxa]